MLGLFVAAHHTPVHARLMQAAALAWFLVCGLVNLLLPTSGKQGSPHASSAEPEP
jgi:hypothetical protein